MENEIRVVVSIDFGTTYSGFAYAHKSNPSEITAHDDWKLHSGHFKTPTVLKYDKSLKLLSWGLPALAERPSRKNKSIQTNPAEKFKLHLGRMKNKPPLPNGLSYKTAIADYLKEMTKVIKETLITRWPSLEFYQQVLIIMTVPNEYGQETMEIMRECAFDAELISTRISKKLKFTTEPEAAAIHCMKKLKEYNVEVDSSFMIVDCGGGTVDLTTHKLLEDDKLDEMTERNGDFCGGSFVDEEFLKFISQKAGYSALKAVRENHYSQLQYMVQEFRRRVKIPFTGKESDFTTVELNLQELCPAIKQNAKGTAEYEIMEEEEWIVELEFEDVKSIFDPVINNIIQLIHQQIKVSKNVSMLMLVGGFSESKYLQERIQQEFRRILKNKICVPQQPITAIEKGAVQFGLREGIMNSRVLKWTYGVEVLRKWTRSDPIDRKRKDGNIAYFDRLVKRGEQVAVDHKVEKSYVPAENHDNVRLDLYVTEKEDAKFCDEPGVRLLGNWFLPGTFSHVLLALSFGDVEIGAIVKNLETGETRENTFELDI